MGWVHLEAHTVVGTLPPEADTGCTPAEVAAAGVVQLEVEVEIVVGSASAVAAKTNFAGLRNRNLRTRRIALE